MASKDNNLSKKEVFSFQRKDVKIGIIVSRWNEKITKDY